MRRMMTHVHVCGTSGAGVHPRRAHDAHVGTRLFLSYFLKGGHFSPLDNNGWEQIYESSVFYLKSLSFTAS